MILRKIIATKQQTMQSYGAPEKMTPYKDIILATITYVTESSALCHKLAQVISFFITDY